MFLSCSFYWAPGVRLEFDYGEQVVSYESDESLKRRSVKRNSTVSSRMERTVNVSTKTVRVHCRTSPQDLSVIIRVDFESWRVSLELKNGSGSSKFVRQDWVDMKGLGRSRRKMIEG